MANSLPKENIIDILQKRGFIDAMTNQEMATTLNTPTAVYCGFDPTSDSLHLGNMVAIMGLAWFQRCGHTPVAIVGGATGMIGDPSGKSTERQLLDDQTLALNLQGIQKNLEAILDFTASNKPLILNNLDWFKQFSFIDFLRTIGKQFRIGTMLAKDSVKGRMESEEGMSFTEFSYQLLQGYDFLHLYSNHRVTLQIGGSDQWGNITAGIDLVRRTEGAHVHGITFPLLTRSDGQKFGKSEKGAIWLSSDKLSPYEFYQYLYRVSDEDVIKLMCMLTFMEMEEIQDYEKQMKEATYAPNTAQKRLAEEVTRIVHGESGVEKALRATLGAAPGKKTKLDAAALEAIAADMPSYITTGDKVIGTSLPELMVISGLQPSKGAARRLIAGGGVSINNEKIEDENFKISEEHLIDHRFLLIAAGKKNKILVQIT